MDPIRTRLKFYLITLSLAMRTNPFDRRASVLVR